VHSSPSTNHFNVWCQKVFLSFICNLTELFLDTPPITHQLYKSKSSMTKCQCMFHPRVMPQLGGKRWKLISASWKKYLIPTVWPTCLLRPNKSVHSPHWHICKLQRRCNELTHTKQHIAWHTVITQLCGKTVISGWMLLCKHGMAHKLIESSFC